MQSGQIKNVLSQISHETLCVILCWCVMIYQITVRVATRITLVTSTFSLPFHWLLFPTAMYENYATANSNEYLFYILERGLDWKVLSFLLFWQCGYILTELQICFVCRLLLSIFGDARPILYEKYLLLVNSEYYSQQAVFRMLYAGESKNDINVFKYHSRTDVSYYAGVSS